MHILVIEDNSDLAANLGDYLADKGHVVDFAGDGVSGLDIMMPGLSGYEVCKRLRAESHRHTPVLMLTARDALDQKLAGFDSGADDYMVKPFALQEIEARLNVLGKRGRAPSSRVLTVSDLNFNLDTLQIARGGKSITLNPIGLKLLQCLMESSPSVVTRRELELRVWGEELPDSDSLRVHIHGLRAAIDKPFDKALIHTRHGIGYSLSDPDALSTPA